MADVWLCSTNDYSWDDYEEFRTKNEAIAWGKREYEDYDIEGFFVGKKRECKLAEDILDVDDVLEQVTNCVYNDNGEYAEDYLDDVPLGHKQELSEELNKVFHAWVKKHRYEPTFFEVVGIEAVSMESEEE